MLDYVQEGPFPVSKSTTSSLTRYPIISPVQQQLTLVFLPHKYGADLGEFKCLPWLGTRPYRPHILQILQIYNFTNPQDCWWQVERTLVNHSNLCLVYLDLHVCFVSMVCISYWKTIWWQLSHPEQILPQMISVVWAFLVRFEGCCYCLDYHQ